VASDPADRTRLRVALGQLAEQDPLIDVRQDDRNDEISVSLYGEVQREVIGATLALDFGVEVSFRGTTTIYVERPVGVGHALERLQDMSNPFSATIGLRVEPAPIGSGVTFAVEIDPRRLPSYIYKTAANFTAAMNEYVLSTLGEGLYGWGVTDCAVTMDECGYYIGDGRGKPIGSTPRTTAADFRKLTPMVLMRALQRAGTVVCGPITRVNVEMPAGVLGAVLAEAARLGGRADAPRMRGDFVVLDVMLPAATAQDLVRLVPGLTGGEGVAESSLGGYEPMLGAPPTRLRIGANPLDRGEYLKQVR
jgi:ribosomal protection tetracycline resistance protein